MSLANKVIAITGAAGAIGREIVNDLAERGALLSLADSQQDKLDEMALALHKKTGKMCMATVIDVRDSAAVTSWIESTVKGMGRLDGAVNCAGVVSAIGATVAETSDEDFDFVTGVNLRGLFFCLRAELGAVQEGASIVNISSAGGVLGGPTQAAYSASKHGVIGLTRSAAKELGPRNIRVNAIAPGVVDSNMSRTMPSSSIGSAKPDAHRIPLQRPAQPAEIAKMAGFLLSSEASYCTGGVYMVDGGFTA